MRGTIGASETCRQGMKGPRLALVIGALLAGAALGSIAVAQSGSDVYTVKKGDTLWDISAEKLGEATRWPEIWNQNQQIKDPHWIYPGDQIRLAGEASSATAGAASSATATPGPQRVRYTRSHSAGFVAKGDFDRAGKITASYAEPEMLYEGLLVFIDRGASDGVRVGDWFLAFRPGEPVMHPKSKKPVGVRVLEQGHLKVVQVGEESSRARIMRSFGEISRGDSVTPFKPFPQEFTVHPAPDNLFGTVVAEQDSRIEAGREDLVYIDIGRKHGVDVGTRFSVYREMVPHALKNAKDVDLPPDVIGEAIVLRVAEETSTMLLTRASDSVQIGDRVAAFRALDYPVSEASPISSDPAHKPASEAAE